MFAKLTRPNTTEVLQRERLFSLLDSACETSILWVSAPAGAGKTTLISSYIESRGLNELWYKVDEGDADLASFFHFFGQAVKNITRMRKKMPALTPEFQLGINEFTRNYFREVFSRLTSPTFLILDNFQDAGNNSSLHQILPTALQEIPIGINVIIISRIDPPEEFSRLRANRQLRQINWADLQFTVDEEFAISKKHYPQRKITKQQIQKLNHHIQGWITGLILLLEQDSALDDIEFNNEELSHEYLFDYFASEVFYKTNSELQSFLLKTSFFPKMNAALCEKLTNNNNAKKILTNLTRKQYFTVQHGLLRPSYEYHPLFCSFLQNLAQEHFNTDELKNIKNNAGTLLAEEGELDSAISLLAQGENWGLIAKLLLKQAKKQIEQGRNKKIIQWTEMLPVEILEDNPWLIYWLGMSYLQYDNITARMHFEKAYYHFSELENAKGLYLSWCGIADSYVFAHDSYIGAEHWIKELDKLQEKYSKPLSLEIRGHLAFSAAGLLLWAQPTHPQLHVWHEKIEVMYKLIPNKDISIMCAAQLGFYYLLRGEVSKLRYIVNKAILTDTSFSYLSVLTFVTMYFGDWMISDYKIEHDYFDHIYKKINMEGIKVFSGLLLAFGMYRAVCYKDKSRLKSLLKIYSNDVSKDSALDQAHYYLHSANLEILYNNYEQALQYNNTAIELVEEASSPYPLWTIYATQAYIYIEKKQFKLAKKTIDSVKHIIEGMNSFTGLYVTKMIYSYIAILEENEKEAITLLSNCLKFGANKEIKTAGVWPARMIVTLCSFALEHNIEPDYAKSIIKLYNYSPKDSQFESEYWPYPIKIYTLNRFGITKNDKPLRLSAKAQQFIKALITLGGRDVHAEILSNTLWPDAEGDTSHQNFATTLHRVRKVLGSDVIQLRQNQVSLDPHFCWVDIWSFKRVMNEIEKSIINKNHLLSKQIMKAINLYQGPFLGVAENEYWMISTREQLSNRFLRTLNKAADTFCRANEYSHALSCYNKCLEIDKLSENIYQGLMRCHQHAGNKAEGLAIYKRCREQLKNTFAIEPSSETEKLHLELKNI